MYKNEWIKKPVEVINKINNKKYKIITITIHVFIFHAQHITKITLTQT